MQGFELTQLRWFGPWTWIMISKLVYHTKMLTYPCWGDCNNIRGFDRTATRNIFNNQSVNVPLLRTTSTLDKITLIMCTLDYVVWISAGMTLQGIAFFPVYIDNGVNRPQVMILQVMRPLSLSVIGTDAMLLNYTLSHPENDRDVTERAQGYTRQDASFMCQSRCAFLIVWENTQVVRAMTSVFLRNTRWHHGRSRGETKYSLWKYADNMPKILKTH